MVVLRHPLVAIGAAAGEAPGEYCRLHTSKRFVDKVLDEDRAEQAGNG